jgi:DNA-binding CsgD family transcriptional regulator
MRSRAASRLGTSFCAPTTKMTLAAPEAYEASWLPDAEAMTSTPSRVTRVHAAQGVVGLAADSLHLLGLCRDIEREHLVSCRFVGSDRARRELLATGGHVRKRTVETGDELTAQEAQIARLAREGSTNPEIGTRLFISPRTVQYHLRKVFTKLGMGSRSQLDHVLSEHPAAVPSS